MVNSGKEKKVEVKYGEEVENEIGRIISVLKKQKVPTFNFDARWIAVKLLEQDREIIDTIKKASGPKYSKVEETVSSSINHITSILRDTPEVIIADARYGFIKGALLEAYKETGSVKLDRSEKIDRILTNRILGIPIFALIIWLMFQFVFTVGKYPAGWMGLGFEKLSVLVTNIVPQGLIRSLLVDGIIGGVGRSNHIHPQYNTAVFCHSCS